MCHVLLIMLSWANNRSVNPWESTIARQQSTGPTMLQAWLDETDRSKLPFSEHLVSLSESIRTAAVTRPGR